MDQNMRRVNFAVLLSNKWRVPLTIIIIIIIMIICSGSIT